MASAAFSIGDSASLAIYEADINDTVSLVLDSVDGVLVSNVRVIATDDSTTVADWPIASATATSTSINTPATEGCAALIEWRVNNGATYDRSTGQAVVGDLIKRAKIAIPTSDGRIVLVPGETYETDPTYGWGGEVNGLLRDIGGVAGFNAQAATVNIATTSTGGTLNAATRAGAATNLGNSTGVLTVAASTSTVTGATSVAVVSPTTSINATGSAGTTNIGTRANEAVNVATGGGASVIVGNATGSTTIRGNGTTSVQVEEWDMAASSSHAITSPTVTVVADTIDLGTQGTLALHADDTGDITLTTANGAVAVASQGVFRAEGFAGVSLRSGGTPTAPSTSDFLVQGLGVSIRANGTPAAPADGEVIIRGTNVEITGTLTNNGSPISGGGGSSITDGTGTLSIASAGDLSTSGMDTISLAASGGGFYVDPVGYVSVESASGQNLDLLSSGTVSMASNGGSVVVDGDGWIDAVSSDGASLALNTNIVMDVTGGDIEIGGTASLIRIGDADTHVDVTPAGTTATVAATSHTETVGSASRTVTASGANTTHTYNGAFTLVPGGNLVLGASGQDAYINCWGFQGTSNTTGFIWYTTNRAFRISDFNGNSEIIARPGTAADSAINTATTTTIATFGAAARPSTYHVVVHLWDASGNCAIWDVEVSGLLFGGAAVLSGSAPSGLAPTRTIGTVSGSPTLTIDTSTTTVRVRVTTTNTTAVTAQVPTLEMK